MFPLFPDWMGVVAVAMFFIGLLATVVGLIAGIVWLCNHIQFV